MPICDAINAAADALDNNHKLMYHLKERASGKKNDDDIRPFFSLGPRPCHAMEWLDKVLNRNIHVSRAARDGHVHDATRCFIHHAPQRRTDWKRF